jgi:hypothetical protein
MAVCCEVPHLAKMEIEREGNRLERLTILQQAVAKPPNSSLLQEALAKTGFLPC